MTMSNAILSKRKEESTDASHPRETIALLERHLSTYINDDNDNSLVDACALCQFARETGYKKIRLLSDILQNTITNYFNKECTHNKNHKEILELTNRLKGWEESVVISTFPTNLLPLNTTKTTGV